MATVKQKATVWFMIIGAVIAMAGVVIASIPAMLGGILLGALAIGVNFFLSSRESIAVHSHPKKPHSQETVST